MTKHPVGKIVEKTETCVEFKKEDLIDNLSRQDMICDKNWNPLIVPRNSGDFKDVSFVLFEYDWVIIKDNEGKTCLVPTKQKSNS